jgi:DNA polymerase-3 subunit delta
MELKIPELLREWKSQTPRPFYYLLGEEAAQKKLALEVLLASFKDDPFNFSEFSGELGPQAPAIISEAQTLPVSAPRRLILVNAPRLPTQDKEALAEYLKDPLPSTTLVILCEDKKPQAADPLCRAAGRHGALCIFSALKEGEAQERLIIQARRAGRTITPEAAAALVAEAGTDWGGLSQELEKAMLFSSSGEIGPEQILEGLGYQKSADPFALPRLIEERRLKESLGCLRRFLKDGRPEEQAFRALNQISSAINRQLRAKLMAEARTPQQAIFKALRLHPYWNRDYLSKLGRLTQERLISDLKRCLETEASLKSKAWLDPAVELEQLIVRLCSDF